MFIHKLKKKDKISGVFNNFECIDVMKCNVMN